MSRHVLYLIYGNYHSQNPQNSKIKNLETLNKMEVDIESSTDQGSKDNKIELISRKISRKRKEMVLKRRNQVLYYLKVLLILLLKNLSHQKMDGMGIAS